MCGFFFIKKNNNYRFDFPRLNKSASLLSHRGPDGSNTFKNKDIYVKFFRLSIQDLSLKGMQPMISESGKNLIVFNGEIYNFKELKKYLPNKIFKSQTDTEVLLALYEKFGTKIFYKIKGMYSFLIYNFETKKILAARDQFGIKPLYFFKNNKYLIFSSEIKPILNYINSSEINNFALGHYFFLGRQDHLENTFFKNIKAIKPSYYYFFLNDNRVKRFKFWSILSNKKDDMSDKYHINNLYKKLDINLNNYLISDKKIGVFLSSGIDSSSLVSFISKKSDYKIDTFTYDFENAGMFGESKIAKKNSKLLSINNHTYILKPLDVINKFDKITKVLESPFTSLRLFAVEGLYNLAKEKKYSVIIEGTGGDEILGGYNYNIFPYILDNSKSINSIIADFLNFSKKTKNTTEIEIINRLMTLSLQGASTSDSTPFVDINAFNKEFLDDLIDDKFYDFSKEDFIEKKKMNNLQKSQYQDIKYIKLPRNLKFADRLSMINNIESRIPFLDVDVAKYCFNLRNSLKIKNNINRWVMKKALGRVNKKLKFPKTKKSVVDPQTDWLKTHLKDYYFDNINSSNFKNLGIFDNKYLNNKFNKFVYEKKTVTSYQYFQILSCYKFIENFKKF